MAKATLSVVAGAWLALTLAFIALRVLPGDAITAQMTEAGFSATAIVERRAALGLDQPVHEQYFRYLGSLLRGDLGQSLYTGEQVGEVIAARASGTLTLASAGFAAMLALSVALAALASRDDSFGRAGRLLTALAVGLPGYISGAFLIFAIGLYDPQSAAGVWSAALVLGFHTGGVVAQALAGSIRQTRAQAFIRSAHGRGLPPRRVFARHILPNAILPVLPLIATQAGFLLGGTVVSEIVFARPGLGRLMLDSVLRRDVPVVQALVLLAALVYGACLLIAQVAARLIDPRPES